jgi:NADH-quinone oxidoreductase subunit F
MSERPLTENIRPGEEPPDRRAYERAGGYRALAKALKRMTPSEVREEVTRSNLRGRGGAGFPTGKKWSFVPSGADSRHPTYLVNNADEMEPGTFKDRLLLEGDPHKVIEGTILAAYAIEADAAYIFLRWAYRRAAGLLAKAIAETCEAGYLGKNILGSGWSLDLHLHVSAGRYMCGEETGLLNSMEGRRATPRAKPPFPLVCGLWGRPTCVNNAETLANVPHIVERGAEWFKGLSRSGDGGTKLYGVSGRVKRPGLWELPMGTPMREILEEHAGGLLEGFRFRGALPGGVSTDFLVEEHLDVAMDFTSLEKAGSRLGTGTIIVLDDRSCPVGMVHNIEKFFARESCGWCTPCREGLPWVERILEALETGRGEPGDPAKLGALSGMMRPGHTFCALAAGAAEPLESALRHFGEDFERHVRERRCPWR